MSENGIATQRITTRKSRTLYEYTSALAMFSATSILIRICPTKRDLSSSFEEGFSSVIHHPTFRRPALPSLPQTFRNVPMCYLRSKIGGKRRDRWTSLWAILNLSPLPQIPLSRSSSISQSSRPPRYSVISENLEDGGCVSRIQHYFPLLVGGGGEHHIELSFPLEDPITRQHYTHLPWNPLPVLFMIFDQPNGISQHS